MSSLVELKYMVFHCVTKHLKCVILSWTEYSFLSKQSAISVHKTAGFLFLNWVSELIWDNMSYKVEAASNNSSEDEGGFEDKPGVSHLQPDQPTTRGHASSSLLSSYACDEEEIIQNGPHQQVQTPSTLQWTWPSGLIEV